MQIWGSVSLPSPCLVKPGQEISCCSFNSWFHCIQFILPIQFGLAEIQQKYQGPFERWVKSICWCLVRNQKIIQTGHCHSLLYLCPISWMIGNQWFGASEINCWKLYWHRTWCEYLTFKWINLDNSNSNVLDIWGGWNLWKLSCIGAKCLASWGRQITWRRAKTQARQELKQWHKPRECMKIHHWSLMILSYMTWNSYLHILIWSNPITVWCWSQERFVPVPIQHRSASHNTEETCAMSLWSIHVEWCWVLRMKPHLKPPRSAHLLSQRHVFWLSSGAEPYYTRLIFSQRNERHKVLEDFRS